MIKLNELNLGRKTVVIKDYFDSSREEELENELINDDKNSISFFIDHSEKNINPKICFVSHDKNNMRQNLGYIDSICDKYQCEHTKRKK